jgi:thiamine pyrophosphate-dependent acetolactate synthase large subunit-like protein
MQSTHTAGNTDLAAMAIAAGFPVCDTVRDDAGLEATLPLVRNGKGPVFLNIKIRAETPPLVLPPKQGVVLKNRFRLALLGAEE